MNRKKFIKSLLTLSTAPLLATALPEKPKLYLPEVKPLTRKITFDDTSIRKGDILLISMDYGKESIYVVTGETASNHFALNKWQEEKYHGNNGEHLAYGRRSGKPQLKSWGHLTGRFSSKFPNKSNIPGTYP